MGRRRRHRRRERALLVLALTIGLVCVGMLVTGVGVRDDVPASAPPATTFAARIPSTIPRSVATIVPATAPIAPARPDTLACARLATVESLLPTGQILGAAVRLLAANPDDEVIVARGIHLIDVYRQTHLPVAVEALRQLGAVERSLGPSTEDVVDFLQVALARLDPLQDGHALSGAIYDIGDDPEIIAAHAGYVEIFRYGREICGIESP